MDYWKELRLPLFPTVPNIRSMSILDYGEELSKYNVALGLFLRLKQGFFMECTPFLWESLAPFMISVLQQGAHLQTAILNDASAELVMECWQKDFISMLFLDILEKVCFVVARIIEAGGANATIRSLDLAVWIEFATIMVKADLADTMAGLFQLLFGESTLFSRQLVIFIEKISSGHIAGQFGDEDLEVLSLMLPAMGSNSINSSVASLLLSKFSTMGNLDRLAAALQRASISPCLSCFEPKRIVDDMLSRTKIDDDSLLDDIPSLSLLPDIVQSLPNCSPWLRSFSNVLNDELRMKEKITLISTELGDLGLKETAIKRALERASWDVQTAAMLLQKQTPIRKDETVEFLDDKRHIQTNLEDFLQRALQIGNETDRIYEDELVDTFDEGHGANRPAGPSDMSKRNNAESLTQLEHSLMDAYIRNKDIFDRTSATRSSIQRRQLCDSTHLTHEQIEGWALLFERNPRKDFLLNDYQLFNPNSRATQSERKKTARPAREPNPRSKGDKNPATVGSKAGFERRPPANKTNITEYGAPTATKLSVKDGIVMSNGEPSNVRPNKKKYYFTKKAEK